MWPTATSPTVSKETSRRVLRKDGQVPYKTMRFIPLRKLLPEGGWRILELLADAAASTRRLLLTWTDAKHRVRRASCT